MSVASGDQLVSQFLDQPCADKTGTLPSAVLVDEKGKIVDWPIGGILSGHDLDLLDGARASDVSGGVTAELLKICRGTLIHISNLDKRRTEVNEVFEPISCSKVFSN